MNPNIRQILAAVGVILAVVSLWVAIPLVVPVILIGIAVCL